MGAQELSSTNIYQLGSLCFDLGAHTIHHREDKARTVILPPNLSQLLKFLIEQKLSGVNEPSEVLAKKLGNLNNKGDATQNLRENIKRLRKLFNTLEQGAGLHYIASDPYSIRVPIEVIVNFPIGTASPEAPLPVWQPSIAVLPFRNLSPEKDQEYFSDGLTEEIINVLAKIPGLKVIARTSVFAFRGKEQDVRTIAKFLGVNTVLEGSVRRFDNRIRVSAQLISSEDGSHLFSDRYDKELADIFAVQDEIAATIAAALQVRLSLPHTTHRHYTPSFPAYEAVLKAWYHFNKLTPDALARGREYLVQATEMDPGYALPYCELGFHLMSLAFMGVMPAHQAMPMARDAARRALEIDSSYLTEAISVLALVAAMYDYDWKEAERLFNLALAHGKLAPPAAVYYGYYLVAIGRTKEAIEQLELSISGDPLNPFLRFHLASWLMVANRSMDSCRECRNILELDETQGLAWITLSIVFLQQGNLEEALEAAERAIALIPWSKGSQGYLAGLFTLKGDEENAERALQKIGDNEAYGAPFGLAHYFLIKGEMNQAADWIARAIEQRSPMVVSFLRGPFVEKLRKSPRWSELMRMIGFPELA